MSGEPQGEKRPPIENPYRDPRPEAFEMMYGIPWDNLPFSRPENLPVLAVLFGQQMAIQRGFKGAHERDEGFALRAIMPFHPDKLLYYWLLESSLNIAGSKYQPDFVQDLLKPNEKFAKAVMGRATWWNFSVPSIGSDMINILGVTDKENNPTGLIYYRTGKNPPRKVPERYLLNLRQPSAQMLAVESPIK